MRVAEWPDARQAAWQRLEAVRAELATLRAETEDLEQRLEALYEQEAPRLRCDAAAEDLDRHLRREPGSSGPAINLAAAMLPIARIVARRWEIGCWIAALEHEAFALIESLNLPLPGWLPKPSGGAL